MPAKAAEKHFDVSSPDFRDGGKLPVKYTANRAPNCVGQNLSPALAWKNAPAGTKSFAILLFDAGGRPRLGLVHWFACGIAPTRTGFQEGEATPAPTKWKGGRSTMDLPSYTGACAPKGVKPHPYVFTVMAYDVAPGAIPAGRSIDDFVKAVQVASRKLLGSASLVARASGG